MQVKARGDGTNRRRDVEAFLRHARHAVYSGGLQPVIRDSVEGRLISIMQELQRPQPRWDLLAAWAREMREILRAFAHPATVMAVDGLRWP